MIRMKRMAMDLRLPILVALFAAVFAILPLRAASARAEYTVHTRRACVYCHVSAQGGGELRPPGVRYRDAGHRIVPPDQAPSGLLTALRLIAGFLHACAGIFWFGIIFYVHVFIGPRNLSGGLPVSEMRAGWIGIASIAATGVILSLLRIHSIDELWTTTFGVVYCVKVGTFLVMVSIASFVTTRLNRRLKKGAAVMDRGLLVPERSESGRTTFIYKGWVYDATGSKRWKDGVHMKRHHAGQDLTEALAGAPHGEEVLDRIKKLGPAERRHGGEGDARPARMFRVLAMSNLVFILIIIMCLAYWNWGPPLPSVLHRATAQAQLLHGAPAPDAPPHGTHPAP
jgi:predicted heme/steroid binding protein